MGRKHLAFAFVLYLLVLGNGITPVFAQGGPNPGLEGLTSIYVHVLPHDGPGDHQKEMEGYRLRYEMERHLSNAGMKILSEEEFQRFLPSRGYPLALVELRTKTVPVPVKELNVMVFTVTLKLRQSVLLARKPIVKVLAPTWELSDTGAAKDLATVKERAMMAVSALVRDLQSSNPK
ncbi:MAG: hypothetical protein KKE57_09655 [Proteobacteria bacterium]|nr:hypothetical protein [Pseudomonadota bacterium]